MSGEGNLACGSQPHNCKHGGVKSTGLRQMGKRKAGNLWSGEPKKNNQKLYEKNLRIFFENYADIIQHRKKN